MVTQWTEVQQAYYRLIKSLRTGKRCTVELIKKFWGIAWGLWEHRNGILHEQQNAVSRASLHALDRNVIAAYASLNQMWLPVHDRHLISLTIARILIEDQMYKETWLTNARSIINGQCKYQWNKRHSNERFI